MITLKFQMQSFVIVELNDVHEFINSILESQDILVKVQIISLIKIVDVF